MEGDWIPFIAAKDVMGKSVTDSEMHPHSLGHDFSTEGETESHEE